MLDFDLRIYLVLDLAEFLRMTAVPAGTAESAYYRKIFDIIHTFFSIIESKLWGACYT